MKKGFDYIGVNVAFFCHDGEGNYLFHKRSDKCRDERGCWDCGGGAVDFGETILDAVKRELKEEYGADPLKIEFLGHADSFREQNSKRAHWIAFRYRILVDKSTIMNNEPEKHEELGWFRLDNLPSPLHSEIPEELEQYKDILL